jgi:hypothetical protein
MTARMVISVVALAMVSASLSANDPISQATEEAPPKQVEELKESCPRGQAGAVVHSRTYVTVGSGQLEQKIYSPWNTIASCMPIGDAREGIVLNDYCVGLFNDAIEAERRGAALFQDDREATVTKITLTGLFYNISLMNHAKRQALGCPNVTFEDLKSATIKSQDAIATKRK